ncbi:MAG: aldose 1-epimerase [Sphingomonadales bacterium]|jgi:aldose 1-epimerase|nr:aldose 1-epimerase [Sphingomonadales bacterium]MEA3045347.1 aldose 1-epimerase [Sphingomonadales bacterium]
MAAEMKRAPFGTLPGGEVVDAIILSNRRGMQARIITYGASVQSVLAPDRDGALADVALGHPTLAPYLDQPQYLGATVGRVANRIAGGRFTLDGRDYLVPVNNGPNSLHGGAIGFDKRNWELLHGNATSAVLRLVSIDGDQGYPGTLTVTATYSLGGENELSVEYLAATDRTTIVNLSNHAYWNLAGEGAPQGAMGHLLTIPAEHYLPTDATAIPTGELRPVEGTPFDFRRAMPVGARVRDASDEQLRFGRGYDHNWVVDREVSLEPRLLARLEDPLSGRAMELLSNQPGIQFYSGNFLDATTAGKAGRLYRTGDAIVLEPQMFPDTPNRPAFGSLRLDPGQTYRNVIVWRFSTAG